MLGTQDNSEEITLISLKSRVSVTASCLLSLHLLCILLVHLCALTTLLTIFPSLLLLVKILLSFKSTPLMSMTSNLITYSRSD